MSTREITDYLTKQLFIEKNIVTYRSLSRKFSIHVNEAKNELATFHYNAPFQSQTCRATFLLSGVRKQTSKVHDSKVHDGDYPMEGTAEDTWEDDDGEEVVQVQVTIVNEADLEAAKDTYSELTSIHIYSVSPAPLHDAGLICGPTELVRTTDKEKGPAYSIKLGRIVAKGIKMGPVKRKPGAPVAGPSKLKIAEPKGGVTKTETKEPTAGPSDKDVKEKEKPKQTGKLQFFTKAKEPVAAKQVKQEETTDSKKKLFFSKPAAAAKSAPEKPPSKAKEPVSVASKEVKQEEGPPKEPTKLKFGPPRGVKRKSSLGLESKEKEKTKDKSPENVASTSKASAVSAPETSRGKRRVVLSDDEDEDDVITKAPPRRKARQSYATASTENSEAEREARALMDIDDDQVEKVSRVPSTNASANELDDEDDQDTSSGIQDEDVSMEEEAPSVKVRAKPRKQKAAVPVGKNGLKKRKVTKTRRTKDANGYIVKEDYSDWESVEEGDEPEEPPAKPAARPKAVSSKKVKKEEVDEDIDASDAAPVAKGKATKESAPAKRAPVKPAAKPKPAAKGTSAKGKTGQQKLNFFGPKKT